MLSLRSFHVFFVFVSIALSAGFGTWGLRNDHMVLGLCSLVAGVLLLVYGRYFVWKADALHLE